MLCSVACQLESGLLARFTYTADFEYCGCSNVPYRWPLDNTRCAHFRGEPWNVAQAIKIRFCRYARLRLVSASTLPDGDDVSRLA
jgi:hypothetical protein